MDRLSALFNHFSPRAVTFHSGELCGISNFEDDAKLGYIHLVQSGELHIFHGDQALDTVTVPSVLFYPRPCCHRLVAAPHSETRTLCASIDLGHATGNPLCSALPDLLIIPFHAIPNLLPTLDILFTEAAGDHCGRQVALDRLMEYFLVLLLRHLIDAKEITAGILAGLGDAKLAKAIIAIHERPEFPWHLEQLADEANMSRARFAAHFRELVGMTPMDYLTDWRLGVAQTLLRRGKSVKAVAPRVGYCSPTAFSRIFARKLGVAPSAWQESHCAGGVRPYN